MRQILYKSTLFSTLLLLIGLFSSCEKNLNMKLPSNERPQITVYGFLYAGEPTYLMLSRSIPITEAFSSDYKNLLLDRATVRYYINGELQEERELNRTLNLSELNDIDINNIKKFHSSLSENHLYYKSRVIPKAGDKIKIEVQSSDLPMAVIEEVLPNTPEVTEVKVERIKGNSISYFGLDNYENYLKSRLREVSYYYQKEGIDLPVPSIFDYVETEDYHKVTFKLKFTETDQFFSVGVPKKLDRSRSDDLQIDTWEDATQFVLDKVLFQLEQVEAVDNSPLFSKKPRRIATQKKNPRDRGAQYFLPYFSSGGYQPGDVVEVETLLPIMKDRKYPSKLDKTRRLAVYAIASEYSYFAEKGYNMLNESEDIDGITDVDVSELEAELSIARSNIKNGVGVVYVASPFMIPLN